MVEENKQDSTENNQTEPKTVTIQKEKNPAKVQAGKKGAAVKLAKMKEAIANETASAKDNEYKEKMESIRKEYESNHKSSSYSENTYLFIGGAVVIGGIVAYYFYSKKVINKPTVHADSVSTPTTSKITKSQTNAECKK